MKNWSVTPKFLLRRDCVLFASKTLPPGKFVEIGAGTGELTKAFLKRGYSGTCYDIGSVNRDTLRENLAVYGNDVVVANSLDDVPYNHFDYLLAFEVLEHIDDDLSALQDWRRYLKDGGVAIISVPSHMKKYGPTDKAVGHLRRYERDELTALFRKAGFTDCRVHSYGFPLANISSKLSNMIYSKKELSTEDHVSLSMRSGIERPKIVNLFQHLTKILVPPFVLLQRAFFSMDFGDGYVLTAKCKAKK